MNSISALQIHSKDYKFLKEAPFATITLFADENSLVGLDFIDMDISAIENTKHPILKEAKSQLLKYFQGRLKDFDLPLDLAGTDFQIKAWKTLIKIPFGQFITYKEQSEKMKAGKAFRAVGSANGKNPIPILIPCHRVVASIGTVTESSKALRAKSANNKSAVGSTATRNPSKGLASKKSSELLESRLGGYSGGIKIKKFLLQLEGAL